MKISLRGLSTFLAGTAFVAFACFAGPNCQPTGGDLSTNGDGGKSGGSGGQSGGDEGGSSGSGGKTSSGSGGSSGDQGGASGSGSGGKGSGGSAKGGSGSGGSAKGGSSGSGNGGSGSGGVDSSGGTTTTSSGGTGGGGTTSATPSGTTVTFLNGKASGAMLGYGWVALGSADTVTDPTCNGTEITSAAPCKTTTTWKKETSLCISGSAPALPASPTDADYASNYGIVVGVNATDPAGGTLGQAFTTMAINATGLPTTTVRAQVHLKGDPDGTSYCLEYTTGAMTLTKFATDCYNTAPSGLLAASKVTNIDKVSLEAVSASTKVTVTDMCITGITFAK